MACSLLLPCEIHWYELGLNPRVAKFVNRERGIKPLKLYDSKNKNL